MYWWLCCLFLAFKLIHKTLSIWRQHGLTLECTWGLLDCCVFLLMGKCWLTQGLRTCVFVDLSRVSMGCCVFLVGDLCVFGGGLACFLEGDYCSWEREREMMDVYSCKGTVPDGSTTHTLRHRPRRCCSFDFLPSNWSLQTCWLGVALWLISTYCGMLDFLPSKWSLKTCRFETTMVLVKIHSFLSEHSVYTHVHMNVPDQCGPRPLGIGLYGHTCRIPSGVVFISCLQIDIWKPIELNA
jgi:hypothetical protein